MNLGMGMVLGMVIAGAAVAQPARIEGWRPAGEPWMRLSSSGAPNTAHHLDASTNLLDWEEIALTHDGFADYPDLDASGGDARFYRVRERALTAADDWRHQARLIEDPFRSPEPGFLETSPRWIKFLILLDEPHRVIFQDSSRYAFHYDFAVARVPVFEGLTREEFDARTLHLEGQQAVVGAVIFAPSPELVEMGIQFAGQDGFPRERIAAWFETVRAVVNTPADAEVFYLPSFEQREIAADNRQWFAEQGIPIRSGDEWVLGDECYASGWAVGRMVFVAANEIEAAYTEGRLGPEDILLTDAVPAETPPLAGIITLSPATPNSHVAILAGSFEIPFAYFAAATKRELLQQWTGEVVVLRATQAFNGCNANVAPLEPPLEEPFRSELLALKQPPALEVPAREVAGVLHLNPGALGPADIRHVGGKAANFGVLLRAIPDHAPAPALAFTFDLWDAYLDQVLPGGLTLREAIAERLAGFTWPPDMRTLRTALAGVRTLVEREADFDPALRAAILAALQGAGFTTDRKIRFRSSTNVEDTERFTGAGLYDSYSGCLGDELDNDVSGPSWCDPTEQNERGVFRALRKVYASFYNDNAFLERLRHRVDEAVVGMGVLVHYSTPDETEWANGVATFTSNREGTRYVNGRLVTQKGAVSVTNPDTAARPEEIDFRRFGTGPTYLTVGARSSLVPLGGTVLAWEAEYQQLYRLLDAAARGYEAIFPAKQQLALDFEYKEVAPGDLLVKQIREVPVTTPFVPVPAWFLGTPVLLEVFQGERGDLISNHRLKSFWRLRGRHTRMAADQLGTSLFEAVDAEFRSGGLPVHFTGALTDLADYRFRRTGDGIEDQWTTGSGDDHRRFTLQTPTPLTRNAQDTPILLLDDLELILLVDYPTDQPTLGFDPVFTTTRQDVTVLAPATTPGPLSLRQSREFAEKGVRVTTTYYWPPAPTGIVAGYTAPLEGWVDTVITGLASEPIVLHDEFAQTYRPGHHNFYEEFVFEPRLDPNVPAALLEELAAQNIRALIIGAGHFNQPRFVVWGLDEKFRLLGE